MELNSSKTFGRGDRIPIKQSDGILEAHSPEPGPSKWSSHTSNRNILGQLSEDLVVKDTIKVEIESPPRESDQENCDTLYTDIDPSGIKPESKYFNCSIVEVEVEFEYPTRKNCHEENTTNSKIDMACSVNNKESKDKIKAEKDSPTRECNDFNYTVDDMTDSDVGNKSKEFKNCKNQHCITISPQIVTSSRQSNSPCDDNLVKGQNEIKSELTDLVNFGKKTFTCSVCNKCFNHKSDLARHTFVHSKEKPFSCAKCSKCFSQKSHFTTHMLFHSGNRPFLCSKCNKSFAQNSDLNRHMLIHADKKENPYTCTVCEVDFNQKSHQQEHIMSVHSGEQLFACSVCSKTFGRNSDLARHMLVHSEKKTFSCTVCDKAFPQKSHFKKHMMIHSGEQPFPCSVCSKRFSRKTDLKRHTLVHSRDKPFSCNVCSKSFSQKAHFTSHMYSHTGDKPFSCSICNKCFTRKSDLKTHMPIHSGEKPFKCSICSKRYSRKAKLINHMLIHS